MSDASILHHINDLIEQERQLRERGGAPDADAARLHAIETELDQCWDLLRQRRALREFGKDPDAAQERPASVVERYEN